MTGPTISGKMHASLSGKFKQHVCIDFHYPHRSIRKISQILQTSNVFVYWYHTTSSTPGVKESKVDVQTCHMWIATQPVLQFRHTNLRRAIVGIYLHPCVIGGRRIIPQVRVPPPENNIIILSCHTIIIGSSKVRNRMSGCPSGICNILIN